MALVRSPKALQMKLPAKKTALVRKHRDRVPPSLTGALDSQRSDDCIVALAQS
jgi:hypothetical protein